MDPSINNNAALKFAIENGDVKRFQLLLADPRVDPSANFNGPIKVAAYYGKAEIVRLLLADWRVQEKLISSRDADAITNAVLRGHTEVVQLLASIPGVVIKAILYYMDFKMWSDLNKLAKMTYAIPSEDDDSTITDGDLMVWGAMFGSVRLVKYLIKKKGVDPAFAKNSAMTVAMKYGQQEVVDYLSEYVQ